MARTLVHNGMLYELPDEVVEGLLAAGIIVPDPDLSADFTVPLSRRFEEVELFAVPARGVVRHTATRMAPIAVAGRGREGQR